MNKIIIFSCLFFASISIAYAQKISIYDQQTKEPLDGVILISDSPQLSIYTNSIGVADISAFSEAKKIQIRLLGYKTLIKSYSELKEADFKIELVHAPFNIDQVLVSATRWHQTAQNVPSKVISILPKEVKFQNPQTAADLLAVSGKIFIQKSQQGGGSPLIRGFATNRLIYTIDGVRMNTAIFRGGNLQNVINLDPFATENTEVLFGPGSVIYGSDAIGGVMSFKTLTPQFSINDEEMLISGKSVMRYSSANSEKTAHFDVNIGWKKWAIITSFTSWEFDHLRQGSHGPDDYLKEYYPQRMDSLDRIIIQDDPLLQVPSAYSQKNLMQKIRFKPNESWDFQYGFHYSLTSPYGRYDRHNRVRNGTARYSEWNYGPQKWMMNNFSIYHNANNLIFDQMTLRLAQQTFEESRISRNFNGNIRERRIEEVFAYSTNIDFSKSINKKNTLYYGLEYVANYVNSTGFDEIIFNDILKADSVINGAARYPNAVWTSLGAYINNEYRLSDNLTLQAGLRYNQIIIEADFSNNIDFYPFPFSTAEVNNGALTASLGGVYRPNEKLVIRANFGTAFRAPNVDDIGKMFDSEPGAVVVPNPDLQAEYAYNFDLGIAKVFSDYVKIDLTGYYTILQNALVRRDFQLNAQDSIFYDGEMSKVQAIQNAAVANVYGLQFGIEVKLPSGFMFLSDLNYQIGKEELDDGTLSPSRHASPMFGVSRLRYKYKDLTLEFNTIYQAEHSHDDLSVSERGKYEIYALDKNGNTFSPAWYSLNFKSFYKLNQTIDIIAGIENISDQRYRPYSSGISAAGRNFILSLRLNF